MKIQYQPKHSTGQEFSQPSSATTQDNDFHSQDRFSSLPFGPSSFPEFSQWTMSDAFMPSSSSSTTSEMTDDSFETGSMPVSESDISNSQVYTFPYNHSMMSASTGHINSLDQTASYSSLSDIHSMHNTTDSGNSPHLAFSNRHGFQQSISPLMVFNDGSHSAGCDPEDTKPLRLDSRDMEASSMFITSRGYDPLPMDTDEIPVSDKSHVSDLYPHAPISPPLTEGNNDASVSSACSQTSFPQFPGQDDTMFAEIRSSISSQGYDFGEPEYRLTPPLSEQDPNRTIRVSKHSQRPLLSATGVRTKEEQDLYPLSMGLNQKSKDSPEAKTPRDHPFYSHPAQADGKYHCPFEDDEKPCQHPPTTQKCAYHKYLDSHLKPYRCKDTRCVDAHFSSNACLFRHEREAHGLHGHGENPHLCHFPTCERAVPGNGFPRRWNLHDHMKRVHDYTSSERVSSPEQSPVSGQQSKKKDTAARKRKGPAKATTMKRVRSTPSHGNGVKVPQSQAQQGQQLQNAERRYYNCLSRLQEDLKNLNPQDQSLHDKANATLQELLTHGREYRQIQAGQVGNVQRSSAYSR
ncbi:hypothetical protein FQN50_007961 [Emmonsiellopsis sp. PD_5]|nr:hypothetical protein FQN50_007961 [Emmonsiellopsis sp. PD_5]